MFRIIPTGCFSLSFFVFGEGGRGLGIWRVRISAWFGKKKKNFFLTEKKKKSLTVAMAAHISQSHGNRNCCKKKKKDRFVSFLSVFLHSSFYFETLPETHSSLRRRRAQTAPHSCRTQTVRLSLRRMWQTNARRGFRCAFASRCPHWGHASWSWSFTASLCLRKMLFDIFSVKLIFL